MILSADGQWMSYYAHVDGGLSSIAVNTGLREQSPNPRLPVLTRLTVEVKGTDDYFFSPEEGDALDRAATFMGTLAETPTGLRRLLGSAPNEVVYAGRRAHAGECLLYFYSERSVSKRSLVALEGHLAGFAWRSAETSDPAWSFYLRTLHPGPAHDPLLLTRAQIDQRHGDGDDLPRPRAVDHTLLLPDEEQRRRLMDEFAGDAEITLRPFEADAGERRFGVTLTLEQKLVLNVIEPAVVDLARCAERFGGTYDGWGALVVPPGVPAG